MRAASCRSARESAGAEPGPACYGRGGTDGTVTDANLVLGYPRCRQLPGRAGRLDRGGAERRSTRSAQTLGIDRMAAAEGIHRVVNTRMAEGIRLVSVRRGVDPRRFALLAFGGAAGLHVTDVARQLDIGRVIVPRLAAVLSAWGMLATDLRYEVVRTHIGDVQRIGAAALRARLRRAWRRRAGGAWPRLRGPCGSSARWTCATASRSSR